MAETKEKKDEKDGQEEKWAKYARRQLVKSYFYLGFLFFVPMLVLYWLGAPLIGCIATGFIVAFFFGVYTLETLPSYGDTIITGGQGKKAITLEDFNCGMKRKYWWALLVALPALAILVWLFLDKQETGYINESWLAVFALLTLSARVICAPAKKVLLLTGLPIMIFSPFVIIGHLLWTFWVFLSKQPYKAEKS
ncbi:hypothetical protein A2W39_03285 [Candidatus Azambacteria bacterium RIFCSPHIGHO2_01_46_10]|uniref:Uncharacterized protein n=4 Tax=Candidatus Azamiibacteriota TaxID=1752741 RepID=A0A1F5C832_9BACT|nr:MAG: hypothetical protein A2W60_03725 [Candidatus Azambacteria bacterium RIFCSPHIGHO2_02_46_12]OGD35716.1 MAG: hypothetical protein A2W39_03285 [Candidatus Azambacteria bacterium RIFCSPHIGHO2_01_46_10]OGD39020.1 MAG: hypothetical protein A3A25_01050 [Candidatus Azambacteria bacterium RIFCSPLOWO2_01_FULL_46_26]OGD43118.1 MAG: hypothetical protein A3J02_03645 [Candidatus Azambacteria bacterium RIFCSPLOWO2_02_FULL_46_11]